MNWRTWIWSLGTIGFGIAKLKLQDDPEYRRVPLPEKTCTDAKTKWVDRRNCEDIGKLHWKCQEIITKLATNIFCCCLLLLPAQTIPGRFIMHDTDERRCTLINYNYDGNKTEGCTMLYSNEQAVIWYRTSCCTKTRSRSMALPDDARNSQYSIRRLDYHAFGSCVAYWWLWGKWWWFQHIWYAQSLWKFWGESSIGFMGLWKLVHSTRTQTVTNSGIISYFEEGIGQTGGTYISKGSKNPSHILKYQNASN